MFRSSARMYEEPINRNMRLLNSFERSVKAYIRKNGLSQKVQYRFFRDSCEITPANKKKTSASQWRKIVNVLRKLDGFILEEYSDEAPELQILAKIGIGMINHNRTKKEVILYIQ